jgi:chromate reductase
MDTTKVAVLVGSLRKDSLSLKLAKAVVQLAPASLEFEFIGVGELPHYNADEDDGGHLPVASARFREQLRGCGAALFVTPEYNRSVPGVLKNAIDVGSRPSGKSVWDKKPAAIISVSPGAVGAFGANHHLRQSLVFLNMPTLQQPEAYVGHADTLFDASGQLTNESTRSFLQTFVTAFETWIRRTHA